VEHVVFFPASDGSPAFRRVSGIEDAVRLVEHLRNVEGINEVSCHALTEVPLAFRTYYRVEVPGAEDSLGVPAPEPAQVELALVPQQAEEPGVDVPSVAAEVEHAETAPDGPVLVEASYGDSGEQAPAMASAGGNGRSSDGAKSLGFFA
jgi:hypothetical protein